MKKYLLFIIFLCFTLIHAMAQTPDANGILYVKKGSTGTGDSWTSATGEVADALNAAYILNTATPGKVTQIWVAGGTYFPAYLPGTISNLTPSVRDNTFTLVKDVKVYGGFAGTETSLTQRNLRLAANISTLSGEIGTLPNHQGDSYHVVVSMNDVGTAELNGFDISHSSGTLGPLPIYSRDGIQTSIAKNSGGGIHCVGSSPILKNLRISEHLSSFSGAGVGVYVSAGNPEFYNVTISGNMANGVNDGVALYNTAGSVTKLVNVTIVGNNSKGRAAVINLSSTLSIQNSIIYGNRDNANWIPITVLDGGTATTDIRSSLIETMPANPALGILDGTLDPLFVDFSTGNFSLQAGSPVIDAGDNSYYTDLDLTTTDLGGYPRLSGNAIDLGAYEYLVKQDQTINAPVSMITMYGAGAFEPGASASSDLAVQYASSDNTIATTFQDAADGNKWKISVLKAGSVIITASQPGNDFYNAAPDISFNLDISKAALTLTPNDVTKNYDGIPYTGSNGFTGTGFVNNDDATVLGGTAAYGGTSINALTPGFYTLTVSGINADNYNISYEPGTLTIIPVESPDANGILYVKKGSTGTGNSWSNAVGELATALNSAAIINNVAPGKVTQIWVAGGRYLPAYLPGTTTDATTNRDYAFSLVKDVKVYGGFAGTETALAQRDLRLVDNTSMLSGYIGAPGSNANNSYHIVASLGDVGSAELNGFAIIGANANSSSAVNYSSNGITEGAYRNQGGGIYCITSSPTLKNLNIRGNTSTSVGTGIYNYNASPKIYNLTISGNTGMGGGTGLYNDAGSVVTLVNITVSGNSSVTASTAAGIMNANSVLYIYNSIIWNNNAASVRSGVGTNGGSLDARSSLIEKMAADPSKNILDGSLDPTFVSGIPPTSNTATTGIFYLSAGSPAINTGTNSYYLSLDAGTTDLGGNPRVAGSAIDLGAYEYGPTAVSRVLYVKKGATGNGSSWNSALGEVSAALRMATLYPGTEEIWVAGGTYQPKYGAELDITSADTRDYTFALFNDIKIYGGFAGNETSLADRDLKLTANKSILDGDMGASGKAYHVVLNLLTVNQAEINGFTITHGMANGTGNLPLNKQQVSRGNGGGIANFSKQMNLSHVDIIDNATIQNAFGTGFGGGIYTNAPLAISYSNISNNKSSWGGGIHNSSSTVDMTNVAVTGNSASSSGGGIYNSFSPGAVLKNVLFSGNSSMGQGGGIYNERSAITLINTTISGNRANEPNGGGGMHTTIYDAKIVSFINSIVYGNSSEIFQAYGTTKFTNSLIKGRANDADNPLDGTVVTPNFVLPIAHSDAPTVAGDYTLQSNSALINAGDNALYPDLDANTQDLAGKNRVTDFATGGIIDLGAYEYVPQLTPQTIGAMLPVTKVYGDAAFEPGATATSNLTVQYASSENTIATASQDAADGNKWKIKPLKAGTVTITASQPGDATYDVATPVTFTLTIDKATLTATASADSKTYDGLGYTGGNGVTYAGFVNNETSALVTGTPTYSGNSQAATNAGTYTITPGGLTAANYAIAYNHGTLTISPATLTATAKAYSRTYNGVAYTGGNGVTYAGFVNNETGTIVTGTPAYTGTSQAAINVGAYTITPGGLAAPNYTMAYANGTLTIAPATLTVTADNQVRCFGVADAAFTYKYSGWVNGETTTVLSTLPAIHSTTGVQSPAGAYDLLPSGAAATNYAFTYVKGTLTINALPASTITAAQGTMLCGTGAALDLQASGGYSFTWKFNNATIAGATGSIQSVNAAGSYTAIATDAIGCTAPASNSVVITQQSAPVAAFTYDSYCADKPVKFTNQSDVTGSGTVHYSWSSGDGANSNAVSPSFKYTAAGNYSVSLTITPAGCPALATTLTKAIAVEAVIPGSTLDAVIASAGMPLQLTGRNLPGAAYSWSPAGGLSNSGIYNPIATLDQNQHFNLLMTFPSGCTTTDNLEVTVNTGTTFLVPNVFSPNGDGQNDILYANLRGIKQMHFFKVYNRWGKQVFETTDERKGWDGRVNGELQPLATYMWTAEGVDNSGGIIRKQGTVTLLR